MSGASSEQKNHPVILIKQFGSALVSAEKLPDLFSLSGEAIQNLIPGAILLISRPVGSSLRITWQSGLDPDMNRIYSALHGDPLSMAFPLPKETPAQHASSQDGRLHHYPKGLSDPELNAVPERFAAVLEQLLAISEVHTVGFAWAEAHYGTLVILLPEGVSLDNASAIETVVLLASGAMLRLEMEDEVRRSEAKYRSLVEGSSEAIGMSRGNRVIYANPALLNLLGYDSLEELSRLPLLDHIAPESREEIISRMQRRDQNELVPPESESRIVRKDGQTRTVILSSHEVVYNGEKCLQTSFHDITGRKIAEESSEAIHKLDSLGILAGGVAHEFNHLFLGIRANIENAKTKIGNISALRALDAALEMAGRAREFTSRLIAFSGGGIPELKRSPVFPLAEELLKITTRPAKCTYRITRAPDLRECLYDGVQLARVLHGIYENAVEAMPSGGVVRLSAVNCHFKKGNSHGLQAGDYVRISVADRGAGIPKDVLPKIFTPFFSTKPRGTGLNLAVALSVLKQQGGTIEAKSVHGKGATFAIYLKAAV